jgi:class 3 adenylate cyclase
MARVLLVDDNAALRGQLREALIGENPDWQIETADGFESARDRIVEAATSGEAFALVLTDLMMGADERAGLNVIQCAQESDGFLMVVLYTGQKVDRYQALEMGAFDCVETGKAGVTAYREMSLKGRSAIRFRSIAESELRTRSLKRFLDARVCEVLERQPSSLELALRTVTVVFWDIRGFSRLCEILKAHPETIGDFLKEYFSAAAEHITVQGGVLDKFIGDGVMALFGGLAESPDEGRADAKAAVLAALGLRQTMDGIVLKWQRKWRLKTAEKISIGLGCGIHSGEALVGNLATEVRDQFTAFGGHVNLAARLQSRADAGKILVSASTAERVDDSFDLSPCDVIKDIRNIYGEYEVYEVIGQKYFSAVPKH